MPFSRPITPDQAVTQLLTGNRRYVEGRSQAPPSSAERIELASGQSPFAVILGCSDSRVPIETVFDQLPGNLFVIRLAGHVVTDEVLATIEYGIAVLGSMLVLVLGHTSCGAVQAAIAHVDGAPELPGHMQRLVDAIAPAVRRVPSQEHDRWTSAVGLHASETATLLEERSTVIADAAGAGRLRVAAAIYDLHTGAVSLLP
jgi:carbonic anhydrase